LRFSVRWHFFFSFSVIAPTDTGSAGSRIRNTLEVAASRRTTDAGSVEAYLGSTERPKLNNSSVVVEARRLERWKLGDWNLFEIWNLSSLLRLRRVNLWRAS
jgi:hypothetical protein